ncbi:MAG: aminotransferase class V-fold PLP-dependent enzyme [Planctomycetes bacterium]|nr:aminotransferase class V-fold PLP-dependent enzyme [Planctomycetota bacterium]
MPEAIYFDNNATTRPLPEVLDVTLRCSRDEYANPSSVHRFGQSARHKVETAREQVAGLIGASPREIVFTSSGTESINLAIHGALRGRAGKRRFVTTAVEHSAGLRVAEQLAEEGYTVEYVGVDREGRLDLAEWGEKLTEDTALASLIHTNNETGVILDVPGALAIAAERGVPVHVDAVQSAGKIPTSKLVSPVDVTSLPVHLMSLAAHKFHGPKGVGALFVRRRTRLAPLLVGGSQERGLRAGTENVAGIVGMGLAAEMASASMNEVAERVGALRDALEEGILSSVAFARVIGVGADRIHNTTNIAFEGIEAEAILILLSEAGVCASSGSACSSGSLEPSHVLKAMGIDERIAHGAIRFSLSRFNTTSEVERVVAMLPDLLSKLTALNRR